MASTASSLQNLEKVWQITNLFHNARNIQETLDAALSQVMAVVNAESGTLWLVDADNEHLSPYIARGPKVSGLTTMKLKKGEGMAGWVVENRLPQIVYDVASDPRWSSRFDQKTGYVTRSILCAPLITSNTTIGCLQLINKRDGQLFDDDDLHLCQDLATLAAIALEKQGLLVQEAPQRKILNRLEEVSKNYRMGEVTVEALKTTSLEVFDGELLVILGPSGSGKSTLLNLLGGMDQPTSGRIFFGDRELSHASEKSMTLYRRYDVGFVFQFYNLIPDLTAGENVALAAELVDDPLRVEDVLEEVGLGQRMDHFPAQMSGGEQQRVSIARAIVKKPSILLCDEPTGALDDNTGKTILCLLEKVAREGKSTVVIVTHNTAIGAMADRIFKMRSGNLVEVVKNPHPTPAAQIEW